MQVERCFRGAGRKENRLEGIHESLESSSSWGGLRSYREAEHGRFSSLRLSVMVTD